MGARDKRLDGLAGFVGFGEMAGGRTDQLGAGFEREDLEALEAALRQPALADPSAFSGECG